MNKQIRIKPVRAVLILFFLAASLGAAEGRTLQKDFLQTQNLAPLFNHEGLAVTISDLDSLETPSGPVEKTTSFLFADFDETIAVKRKTGPWDSGKYFVEEELKWIVASSIDDIIERFKFLRAADRARLEFYRRRDEWYKQDVRERIPYHELLKIWLEPFKRRLHFKHIQQLVDGYRELKYFKYKNFPGFELDRNFIRAAEMLKEAMGVKKITFEIASGSIGQIMTIFLAKEEVQLVLEEHGISFKIGAAEMVLVNKVYRGRVTPGSSTLYGLPGYPDFYAIIGDNGMLKIGFQNFLNAQDFDERKIADQIQAFVTEFKNRKNAAETFLRSA